jgi:hydrogenase expression/formation protein HypD
VYSPEDCLNITQEEPKKQVVFFAIGFETTAPTTAMTIRRAHLLGVDNFTMLVAHVLIPPAMELILSSPLAGVQAFLAAGHVCTVTGLTEYERLSSQYTVPIVVTGFEPLDILQGIYLTVAQLEQNRAEVENQYTRVVNREGNANALNLMREVFTVCDRNWRGLGKIAGSGLALSEEYTSFDAEKRFGVRHMVNESKSECISGLILRGTRKPVECPAFGSSCTPEQPLGATMVSTEGACNAYYRYRSADTVESSAEDSGE